MKAQKYIFFGSNQKDAFLTLPIVESNCLYID